MKLRPSHPQHDHAPPPSAACCPTAALLLKKIRVNNFRNLLMLHSLMTDSKTFIETKTDGLPQIAWSKSCSPNLKACLKDSLERLSLERGHLKDVQLT